MHKSKIINIAFYLFPSLVSALIPIITLPIISNRVSLDEYGVHALSIAFGTFLSGLGNMGLIIGYERNFFEQKSSEEHGKLLFTVVTLVFFFLLILGFFTYFMKGSLSYWIFSNERHGYSLLLGYMAVSISSLKSYFLIYYKNKGNAKSHAWFSIDEIVINAVVGIFLVVYLDMGINGLLIGQVVGGSLVISLLFFRFLQTLPFGFSKSLMKKCFAVSFPLTPRIFFGIIGTQFDKYLINLLGTLGGVGLYNLGQKMAYMVFNYMTALQNVYSPKVYELMFDLGDDSNGKIGKYLTLPFFFSSMGGLSMALFSEEVIFILTPPSYHEASKIVSVLSLMYVLYFFGKQPQLIYAKKTGLTSLLTLLSIIINIVVNIPLVQKFGGNGAAFGSLLSALISGAVSFYVAQKFFFIRWELNKIFFCLGSMFLLTFANIYLIETELIWNIRFIIKILFLALFIFGGFAMKIITFRLFFSFFKISR